jgi:hypothetical protein
MEFAVPISSHSKELQIILKELPEQIQNILNHNKLYDILVADEKAFRDSHNMSLVLIDSSKFEFFLSSDSGSIRLFDEIIMSPYLNSWSSHNFVEITTTQDFVNNLLQYISLYFPEDEIHSLSLLIHFPGASNVSQWSHMIHHETK